MCPTLTRYLRGWLGPAMAAVVFACGGTGGPSGPSLSVTPTYSVTGTVRDASPVSSSSPVAGAMVAVMDGPFAGKSAVTDEQGVYRLFVLSGSFKIRVASTGYEDITLSVGPLTANVIVDAQLTRTSGTVSGRVTESAPTQTTAVPGARLRVLNGSAAGTTITADRDGNFSLGGLSGAADVVVQADGFTDATVRVDPNAPAGPAVGLTPTPRTIVETVGDYPPAPRRLARSFFRDVHTGGSIVVSKLYFYYAFDAATNPPTRTIELWDGSRLVAAATINQQQWHDIALDAHVDGGRRYEIRITGGEWNVVTLSSPN